MYWIYCIFVLQTIGQNWYIHLKENHLYKMKSSYCSICDSSWNFDEENKFHIVILTEIAYIRNSFKWNLETDATMKNNYELFCWFKKENWNLMAAIQVFICIKAATVAFYYHCYSKRIWILVFLVQRVWLVCHLTIYSRKVCRRISHFLSVCVHLRVYMLYKREHGNRLYIVYVIFM